VVSGGQVIQDKEKRAKIEAERNIELIEALKEEREAAA